MSNYVTGLTLQESEDYRDGMIEQIHAEIVYSKKELTKQLNSMKMSSLDLSEMRGAIITNQVFVMEAIREHERNNQKRFEQIIWFLAACVVGLSWKLF